MKYSLAALAAAAFTYAGLSLPAHAEGRIMITSYVNEYTFAAGNIGCPKGPWGNAFVADVNKLGDRMNMRDYELMFELISEYEIAHGLQVEARSRVNDYTTVKDGIRTQATGPVDAIGAQLCSLVAANM